jgi:HSP20 family protein
MDGIPKTADIDVSLQRRMLTIEGEKKQEKEEKGERHLKTERAHGMFPRTIELPTDLDPESVEAVYKKGVLALTLEKTAPSESKKITIKAS